MQDDVPGTIQKNNIIAKDDGAAKLPSVLKLRQRYNDLLEYARWVLWWEATWPVLWHWVMVAAFFVCLSWLGLWVPLSGSQRFAGVLIFITLILWFGIWPFIRMRLPDRSAAQHRITRDSALEHNPVHTIDDQLIIGSDNLDSQRLWALHQKSALNAVEKMRVSAPSPDMPRRDPFALRYVLLLALLTSALYAGAEREPRLKMAFDWSDGSALSGLANTTGWVAPPSYTGQPTILLDFSKKGGSLIVPVGSSIVIRTSTDSARVSVSGGVKKLEKKPDSDKKKSEENQKKVQENAQDKTDEEANKNVYEYRLESPGALTVSTSWFNYRTYDLNVIPDLPPIVSFNGEIKQNYKGAFTLSYRTKDDYGIAALFLELKLAPEIGSKRSLVPPPEIKLTLPPPGRDENVTEAEIDISEHPWAGAPVQMTIVAVDDYNNTSRSETIRFELPQRRFGDPLAAALAEQRQKTVLYPDDTSKIKIALNALMIAPEEFTDNVGVYIGLSMAAIQLRNATTDKDLVTFTEDLWSFVQALDDGRLSDAKAALKEAQERLEDAIARGAPEDEIKQLTKEYQQAMNRYMRELAEASRKQNKSERADGSKSETITRDQLNDMLKKIEEAMKRGDTVEAQRLMEELAQIMENLQMNTAEGKSDGDPLSSEMDRSSRELNDLMREQQQLQDETFKKEKGEQKNPFGQSDPSQGEGKMEAEKGGGLEERQQRLRQRMEQLRKGMKGLGMEKEERFADAEKSMKEAEDALKEGDLNGALEAQKDALKNLGRGARNFARQKQEMLEAEGLTPQDSAKTNPNDKAVPGNPYGIDPNKDDSGGIESSPSTRVQRIIEELRRKLSEPNRSEEEQNYFERLLKLK